MDKNKKFELNDDALDNVVGGNDDDGWYNGWGHPADYPNACPKCGKGVYKLAKGYRIEIDGRTHYDDDYQCESCDYLYSKDGVKPIGVI